jgi:phosphatidylserine/phosphatidylglycerophosphate/cardiolipin synthase-like enzyme
MNPSAGDTATATRFGFGTMRLALGILVSSLCASQLCASEIRTCFTPGEDCTALIVQQIEAAKSELLVQGFLFNSVPILQAIGDAKDRGVAVKVVLDRVNEEKPATAATYLLNRRIRPLIDDKVATAHNKVMVIDGRNTITGSFNFTTRAQARNAENVLVVLDDPVVAKAYADNWRRRAEVSRKYRNVRARSDAPISGPADGLVR